MVKLRATSERQKTIQAVFNEPEPVGEGHHDVQRGQEEDEMEEEVAVSDSLRLVVNHLLTAFALLVDLKLLLDWKRQMYRWIYVLKHLQSVR